MTQISTFPRCASECVPFSHLLPPTALYSNGECLQPGMVVAWQRCIALHGGRTQLSKLKFVGCLRKTSGQLRQNLPGDEMHVLLVNTEFNLASLCMWKGLEEEEETGMKRDVGI